MMSGEGRVPIRCDTRFVWARATLLPQLAGQSSHPRKSNTEGIGKQEYTLCVISNLKLMSVRVTTEGVPP